MSTDGMVASDSGIGGKVLSCWLSVSVVVIGGGDVLAAVVLIVAVLGVMVVSSAIVGVGVVVVDLSVNVVVRVHR